MCLIPKVTLASGATALGSVLAAACLRSWTLASDLRSRLFNSTIRPANSKLHHYLPQYSVECVLNVYSSQTEDTEVSQRML
jgi:hypothetical protein